LIEQGIAWAANHAAKVALQPAAAEREFREMQDRGIEDLSDQKMISQQ